MTKAKNLYFFSMIRITINLGELLISNQSATKIKAALKCAYLEVRENCYITRQG